MLVGVYDGGLTGIDTYAEQVAIAGAAAGNDVTLLATTRSLAHDLQARLPDTGIRVMDLGLQPMTPREAMWTRLWPGFALRRLERGLIQASRTLGKTFPVVHLNHPGLSRAARPLTDRVCVAAWFYPHDLRGRVVETWRHTHGNGPRSLVLVGKSVSHYWNDARGYRHADCVTAPTELLAGQLLSQGIRAVVCPPPVRSSGDEHQTAEPGEPSRADRRSNSNITLLICCGDLSHPRKNVAAALRAVCLLPSDEGRVTVELIGRNGAALEPEVQRLPGHVTAHFTGPLPAPEVQAHMRAADALLFPSLYEEWGYVAVESMLCGTPVVTFPVYPFPDMLAPGFGQYASDMTDGAFADAVQQVLARGRPPGLAAAAAARFGSDAIGRRLTDIWLVAA